AFYAYAGGFFGQLHLSLLVDVELSGFPGVIENGPEPRSGMMREDRIHFQTVQRARGAANSMCRVAAIKRGRLEMFPGAQEIPEIERIRATGYAHLLERVLLDCYLPGAAPRESTEPNIPTLLVVVSFVIDR